MTKVTKAEWDTEVDRLFINNTNGDIEADEVKAILNDLSDSITFGVPDQTPSIKSFLISGQDITVDPNTELSGLKTFIYNVANRAAVSGNLTLTQGNATLSAAVDPAAITADITINTVTLAAGESVVFTLSGIDGSMNAFSKTFTVTARNLQEFVYFGVQATDNGSSFDFANQSRTPFVSGSQTITVPTFSGDQHLVIAQLASEPDLTSIFIGGVNQIGAFTKTPNAFLVNSQNYDTWITKKQLQGSVVSGNLITLGRS